MNCGMCPGWMTVGMVVGTLIGVLLIVLLVVLIVRLTRFQAIVPSQQAEIDQMTAILRRLQ